MTCPRKLCAAIVALVEYRTGEEAFTHEETARVYREIAGECFERALELDDDDEANAS